MKSPTHRKASRRGEVRARSLSIKVRRDNTGWKMSCPIGLWSVSGPDKIGVFREAIHYFGLYWEGGEYDHLFTPAALKPTSP